MTTSSFSLPNWFSPALVAGMRRGLEKEGLRVQKNGVAAQTPHPHALGSKLTHPYITTDYSENLLELITEPFDSIDGALAMLRHLHIVVHQALDNELMWALSMPSALSDDDKDIPLANYGSSNIGQLKTLYRSGLGVRYGRKMQTIAGLHYNLSIGDDLFGAWQHAIGDTRSFSDFKNASYLALIRNFKRLTPMVLYLIGASPSVSACFVKGRPHDLQPLNVDDGSCGHTLYKPFATSLRMGKLGYTNSVQDSLDIRYNDLNEYIKGLRAAIQTPFAPFSAIGVDDEHGTPIQINDHILQIENEYYSPIRPKQVTKSGETPTHALEERGIAYVEFRAIDLNPYSDIGIDKTTACFLEILALYCLFSDSPALLPEEERLIASNIDTIVNHGRQTGVTLTDTNGTSYEFNPWMLSQLHAMYPLAQAFDAHYGNDDYHQALTTMIARAQDSALTPSARLIDDSITLGSTLAAGLALSQKHQDSLLHLSLSQETRIHYEHLATQSWTEQAKLEQSDTQPFYDYIQAYRHF